MEKGIYSKKKMELLGVERERERERHLPMGMKYCKLRGCVVLG